MSAYLGTVILLSLFSDLTTMKSLLSDLALFSFDFRLLLLPCFCCLSGLQWVPIVDGFFSEHVALSRGISNSTMAARRRTFYQPDPLERRRGGVRVPIANIDQ